MELDMEMKIANEWWQMQYHRVLYIALSNGYEIGFPDGINESFLYEVFDDVERHEPTDSEILEYIKEYVEYQAEKKQTQEEAK